MQVNLNFREANESDVPALVDLLADDVLGAKREDISIPINPNYLDAFHSIEADSNNELTVVEADGGLVGMLQLTFIPYLTHIGSWRCLIEGVRIANTYRGKGLGTEFINWAIKRAKERRCSIVQLSSDKNARMLFGFMSHSDLKLHMKDLNSNFRALTSASNQPPHCSIRSQWPAADAWQWQNLIWLHYRTGFFEYKFD